MAERVCPECKEPLDGETEDCPVCLATDDKAGDSGEAAAGDSDEATGTGEPQPAKGRDVIALPTIADRVEAGDDQDRPEDTKPEPPKTANTGETAAFFTELRKIKEEEYFAILFFGFRTAGKTWLLHRMKEQLIHEFGITCDPKFEPVAAKPGERKPLPGTTAIEFHYVFENPSFVLIDIPGEYTEYMIEWDFDKLRMLLAAMDYAKAIIIALPSDVLLFGHLFPDDDETVINGVRQNGVNVAGSEEKIREWAKAFRADHDNIEKFAYGMFHVAGLLSYLRHAGIDPENAADYAARVTFPAVRDHMARGKEFVPVGGADGLDCPTFIALTKADRVLSLFSKSDDPILSVRNREIHARLESRIFESLGLADQVRTGALPLRDPWQTVRNVNPALHSQFLYNFPFAKFDYVTAFYGHDGLPSLTRDHYKRHPQGGVIEVLEWIRDARAIGNRRRWMRAPFRWAAQARRYLAGMRQRSPLVFEQGRRT